MVEQIKISKQKRIKLVMTSELLSRGAGSIDNAHQALSEQKVERALDQDRGLVGLVQELGSLLPPGGLALTIHLVRLLRGMSATTS